MRKEMDTWRPLIKSLGVKAAPEGLRKCSWLVRDRERHEGDDAAGDANKKWSICSGRN
jgi:hypothetical protein